MGSEHAHDISAADAPRLRLGRRSQCRLVIIEAGVGFATGSLSLLADAVRNLTDVGGLLIAWGAAVLALRKPTARHTYAYEPERRPL